MLGAAGLIGNDVVDLDDPDNRRSFGSARFAARIASPEESEQIESARDPYLFVASLFAAKEAAFKVVTKLAPSAPFAHRRFRVGAAFEHVEHDEGRLPLTLTHGGGFVHAVVSTERCSAVSASVRAVEGEALSVEARALLCEMVAARLACEACELAVVRTPRPGSFDGFGPPRLERRGAKLTMDVSLSHDGRFVAAAFFDG